MKRLLIFLWVMPLSLIADDVYCKDGKVYRGLKLRKESGFIFGKHLVPKDPQEQDAIIVANQVDRIVFSEPQTLRELRQAAYAGDAALVLEKGEALIAEHRQWADTPGNYWRDLMRSEIPALYVLGKTEALQKLIKEWVPTGDPDLEDGVKLVAMRHGGAEKAAFLEICKKATATNPGSLVAAIAWIELGHAALEEKNWPAAVRSFLSVEVFASAWRLLLPEALLGAVRACVSNGQQPQAAVFAQDLRNEYASSPQAARATEALSRAPR